MQSFSLYNIRSVEFKRNELVIIFLAHYLNCNENVKIARKTIRERKRKERKKYHFNFNFRIKFRIDLYR